jgi:hypothetical protein
LKPAIAPACAPALCRADVPAPGDPCLQLQNSCISAVPATPATKPSSGHTASAVQEQQQQLPARAGLAALRPWLADSRLRGWEGEGSQGTQLVATVPYCRPLACLTQVNKAELCGCVTWDAQSSHWHVQPASLQDASDPGLPGPPQWCPTWLLSSNFNLL